MKNPTTGGVEKSNRTLEETVQTLKQIPTPNVFSEIPNSIKPFVNIGIREITKTINDILYGAINHHPTTVNAIHIKSLIRISEGDDNNQNQPQRNKLKKFLRTALELEEGKQLPNTVDFEFIKHLPYESTEDRIGTNLVRCVNRFINNLEVPYVQISLSDREQLSEKTYLLPNEISSIRLLQIPDDYFTPIYTRNSQRELILTDPDSTIIHYAKYLGFSKDPSADRNIPYKEWKPRLSSKASNIWVSKSSSKFFRKLSGETSAKKFFSGFALSEQAQQMTLYEFDRVRIPFGLRHNQFSDEAILAAYGIYKNRKSSSINISTYVGDEVMRILAKTNRSY